MRRTAAVLMTLVTLLVGAAPAYAGPDTRKPKIRITTQNDSLLIGAPVPHDAARISGMAKDVRGSGVATVTVYSCANARRYDDGSFTCGTGLGFASVGAADAALDCRGAKQRRCTWSAPAPTTPGRYVIVAEAVDRAGNSRTAGPIFVTVV